MKILITGSNGQLGKELSKRLSEYELTLTSRDEINIIDIDNVIKSVRDIKPDVIINCAAHTAVDLCEKDIDNAYKINAIGARNLAIASNEIKSKIVQISTDYVFDGENKNPYTEFDCANPQTIYGKTKLEGEHFVSLLSNKYFIIRTAWLYGDGNNFVKTMINLSKDNKQIKVVNDQYGTPTSTAELANMIKYLINTQNYGLFHGTCEGSCTWYEFAKEIFRLSNIDVEVIPVSTQEFPRPAKRPKYCVLSNYMLKITSNFIFSTWEEAISKYIN